ncbi:glycoside hydrolase 5 family protein [Kribbella italica]|uniref:mannan endo-1,4-beta-mannosidase n=1 Tax=Kribbella italica TaxID=1540520 RepID=A0A7W9J590_9ACTN|nr:cellulase family glycosylhydrolase [Kribbella italica]MBB5835763.1 mannan endo-1,4-beta-mannosidase [Kribbella italica]
MSDDARDRASGDRGRRSGPQRAPSRRQLLVGAGTAAGVAAVSATGALPAAADSAASPWPRQEFVTVRGGEFWLSRRRWRWTGTNCYYLHNKSHYMIDSMLNNAKAMSLEVVRAWAFFDGEGEGALQPAPYEYDDDAFDALDYTIYKAGQLGLRLVLPLVNNWPDYGGMRQYVDWFLALPDDSYGAAVNHDRFYTDDDIRRCFLGWVRHVIERRNPYTGRRYRDEPAIMTWELANEPRNRSDPTGHGVLRWASDVSRAVKRLAPRQLVAVGDEGMGLRPNDPDYPYSTYEGNRWLELSALPAIDYATVHLYPQSWGRIPADGVDPIDWGRRWITDHVRLGRDRLRKPVVLEEFGLEIEESKGVPDLATRNRGYDQWLTDFEGAGGAGTQFWILTALTDAGIPYDDYDGYRVLYPSDTAELISRHARSVSRS